MLEKRGHRRPPGSQDMSNEPGILTLPGGVAFNSGPEANEEDGDDGGIALDNDQRSGDQRAEAALDLVNDDAPHPRNTLNDMSGARFLYFTKSVLSTAYPSIYGHHLRKKHGANKPPQIMALLIEFFTKSGMAVLDPFAGVGGTLIGASMATPE